MLRWRLFSSALIISLLVTAAYFDLHWGSPEAWDRPGVLAAVFLTLFGWLAAWEFASLTLTDLGSTRSNYFVLGTAVVGVIAGCCLPGLLRPDWRPSNGGGVALLAALACGLTLAIGEEMWRYGSRPQGSDPAVPGGLRPQHATTGRIAVTVLAMIYIGLPLGLLGLLRQTGSNAFGLWALLSVLVIPKVSDSGAYFVGRTWGRHKLIPRLSPGKTVEGAVGGLIFGIFGAWLMGFPVATYLFGLQPPLDWVGVVGYGLWLSGAGMLGDLAESMFKRDAQIKDSGGWLPGLGGMLDVVDSVLAASLAAYLFWQWTPGVPQP